MTAKPNSSTPFFNLSFNPSSTNENLEAKHWSSHQIASNCIYPKLKPPCPPAMGFFLSSMFQARNRVEATVSCKQPCLRQSSRKPLIARNHVQDMIWRQSFPLESAPSLLLGHCWRRSWLENKIEWKGHQKHSDRWVCPRELMLSKRAGVLCFKRRAAMALCDAFHNSHHHPLLRCEKGYTR